MPAVPLDIAIDVSDNQPSIDWRAVYGAGIRIAFCKVMEWPDRPYPSGPAQLAGARRAGIVAIPYGFLRPCDPDVAVREFALRAELGPGMPCALDWEGRASQTCTARVAEAIGEGLAAITGRKTIGYWGIPGSTPAAPTARMTVWERWVPRYPMTGANRWASLSPSVRERPERYWLAGPHGGLPRFGQYTAWGRVPGIAGLVDRSVAFFASIDDAVAWCGSGAAAATAPAMTIADAQAALNAWGIVPPLAVDGDLGDDTADALRVFQHTAGVPETGALDEATITALTTRKQPDELSPLPARTRRVRRR